MQEIQEVLSSHIGDQADAEATSSKRDSGLESVESDSVAADKVAGTPTRRKRSDALASRKTFGQPVTKITNL